MTRLKVIYIVSNVHKSLAFEWIAKGLRDRYDLSFILLNPGPSAFEEFLTTEKIPFKRIAYRTKRDLPLAFLKVFFFFLSKTPDAVHAHLLDAQLIGLTAAKLSGVKKRIYTRHNSNLHHVYHPSGVKYDEWSNRLATKIISISQATDKTLFELENVKHEKVVKIPHGFDWSEFENIDRRRVERMRSVWKIPNEAIVIGVIARHIEWKGVQYIIPAFREFNKVVPNSVLVLANSSGPYHSEILEMLKDISPDKIISIPFEQDVAALYKTFSIYVHTPVDSVCEAFGQTYVEALATGIPSIFTLSGVAAEFIKDGENALVVSFKDSPALSKTIARLYNDDQLQRRLIENGKRDVISRFGMKPMLASLETLYDA